VPSRRTVVRPLRSIAATLTPVASPCHNASLLFKTAANVIYLAAATVRRPKAEVRRWLARTPQIAALTRQGAAL
jgi:hypothetical protein